MTFPDVFRNKTEKYEIIHSTLRNNHKYSKNFLF